MTGTILIVEDETDLAATCVRVLRRRHWPTQTVETYQAALAAIAAAHRPALAIVDRQLPDGDGLDVLRAARAAGTPVIVMSAYDWAATRRLALEAGAVAFLGKPFSMQDLLAAVESVLGAPPFGSPGGGQAGHNGHR
jgi:DNA-binding response OmpR family regulator